MEEKMRKWLRISAIAITSLVVAYSLIFCFQFIFEKIGFYSLVDFIGEEIFNFFNLLQDISESNLYLIIFFKILFIIGIATKKFLLKSIILTAAYALIKARAEKEFQKIAFNIIKRLKIKKIFIAAVIIRHQFSKPKNDWFREHRDWLITVIRKEREKRFISRITKKIQPKSKGWLDRMISRVTVVILIFTMLLFPKTISWILSHDMAQNQILKLTGREQYNKIDAFFQRIVENSRFQEFLWNLEKILLISIDSPKDFIKKIIWRKYIIKSLIFFRKLRKIKH